MAKFRQLGLVSAFAIAIGGLSTPAFAQDAAAPEEDATKDIVVTGSLIRGSSEQASAPIDVIGAEELARQGSPSVIDLLKNLPTSNGVIGDANQFDARAQGNEGVASVNLRGLGPQRTLVLLNGKRIVASGGSGIPIVDVNLIPSGAIGRIEVLKDGAAATYGSDAIAGVVNFITRENQNGFRASADYRYIRGSKGDYGGALSYGHTGENWRFLVSGGVQHRSELQTLDRDFVIQGYPDNPQGGWTGGGNPGNFDFSGAGNGLSFTTDLGCTALGGFRSLPGSTTDRCFNQYGLFGNLVEPEDRFQFFVDTEFDLSEGISLRLQGLWGHSETRITTSPSYLPTLPPSANAAFGGAGLFVIPGYTPALQDYCATYGAAANCLAPGGILQSAVAFPVLFRPVLLGGNPLFGGRGSATSPRVSDQLMFSADLEFELTANLDLRLSFTHSEYDRSFGGTDTFGDLFQNAIAGFGGPNCAYSSTASRVGLTPAQLAALAGTNGCQYWNPFSTAVQSNPATGQVNPQFAGSRPTGSFSTTPGAGLVNDPALFDWIFQDTRTQAFTRQTVFEGVISGKSGLSLPGGEVGFALGGQYRKNAYRRFYSDTSNLDVYPCPGTPLNPAATCTQQTGALGFLGTNRNGSSNSDVWAMFAELQLPITDAFDVQLSARYEDYGGAVGSTFDPQVRAKFQVTPWLALRGGWGTTFRGPPSQSLAGNLTSLQIIGTSFRAIDINSNPNLAPESANTYNGGVLISAGGFKASVDYFRYDFEGPIEGEPVSGIVSALFGATGNANCGNPAYAAL